MTVMEDDREIYPNAPIVLAALEVRHPAVEPLSQPDQNRMKRLLVDYVPILREATVMNLQATVGVGAGPPEVTTVAVPKFFSRDRTTAVTFRADAFVIETTKYGRYERIREVAAAALDARQEVAPVDGVERLGLRYIDEIRVPGMESAGGPWDVWVASALTGSTHVGEEIGLPALQWQGTTVFNNGPERTMVLRYGPRDGYAVDPAGDLKRSAPPPGPFFLIDIDSFWEPENVPEMERDHLLRTSDALHAPVRRLFEALITEKLRKEVLRLNG